MNTKTLEAKALKISKDQSTETLIEAFEVTERLYDEPLSGGDRMVIATVRGWIFDELERRDSEAMFAWCDTPEMTSADLRRLYL